jgi:hypothetical protein
MKRSIKTVFLAILVYISVVCYLTPTVILVCYIERGYFSIGGEWGLLLTIPIMLAWLYDLHMTAVREARKERTQKGEKAQ